MAKKGEKALKANTAEKNIMAVIACKRNHPSGQFRKAGFIFGTKPQIFQLTVEEWAEIQKHAKHLIIKEGKKAAERFTHLGIKEAVKEADIKPVEVVEAPEDPALVEGEAEVAEAEEAKTDPTGKNDELIKALEDKGLKAGVDFEADADKEALEALLAA